MHTGDPKQDLAYERQYEQQTYQVIPEVIKNFIQYFHKTVSDLIDQKVYELQASRVSSDVIDQKVYEIQDIYENSWTKLTERFFKNTPWPEAEAIAPQVGNDAVFLILYKELYYRHIYAKVSVSVCPVSSCGLHAGFSLPANLTSLAASTVSVVPLPFQGSIGWVYELQVTLILGKLKIPAFS
ncbi:eukaryotic translation initiation factor 3 subunit L-like [Cyanistes caeruleus]|uniref:eukaryotic translation initiation factor 3 subunit L-like n=1 Tax=Cyanistes caeruleus TaxID=156563 RepID=UPI000CDA99BF|nr:eukaryotic translation initiation factor 3 subunit L-like [Cyanistes caeruleus]